MYNGNIIYNKTLVDATKIDIDENFNDEINTKEAINPIS